MALRHSARLTLGCVAALGLYLGVSAVAALERPSLDAPLTLASARVSIAGTSNIHEYTASTSTVRVTRVQVASVASDADFWNAIVTPGAFEAFEIAIPAATLSSPKEGLDKNMHKALKVTEHPDIVFKLIRLESRPGAAGALRGVGMLTIAGVEREVALDLTTEQRESTLAVHGTLHLLMTDYGIKPPVAMLGMLKTDPKITVTFDTVVAVPLT